MQPSTPCDNRPILPVPAGAETLAVVGAVLDGLGVALCMFDLSDRTVLWNQAFLRFFPEHEGHIHVGEPYADNLRRFYRARLPSAELPHIERFVADGLARHQAQARPYSFEHNGQRLTVASLPVPSAGRLRVWTAKPVPAPMPGAALAPLPDALFNVADGAAVLRDGRIIAANDEFLRLYDLRRPADAIGATFADVVRRAWDLHALNSTDPVLATLDNPRFTGAAFEVALPLGRWRRVIERQAEGGLTYASHADISALKQQQWALQDAYDKLEILSVTDSLTGIANRRRFEQHLANELEDASRSGRPLSLLLVDVDRFKHINDAYGHPGGDACLQRLATLVTRAVRRYDLAARLGGDEFALLLPGASHRDASALARSLCAAIAGDGGDPPMTVSIGVATLDGALGQAGQSLVSLADRALYAAKRAGRNRVCGPEQGSNPLWADAKQQSLA